MSIVCNNAFNPNISRTWAPYAKFDILVPEIIGEPLSRLIERCHEKHGNYMHLVLDTPHKSRSTGPGSQSAHLHGHLQQLAQALGLTMTDVKDFMKRDCPFWPSHEITIGKTIQRVYLSEADVDSATEAKAIDWTHQAALDCGITLKEE